MVAIMTKQVCCEPVVNMCTTLQEYDTYLAQMYLQTVLEEADTEQQQHQQPVAASTEGSSQNALQQSGTDAATPELTKAATAQQDAYAKLKHLVSTWVTADAAAFACVLSPQPEAPQASAYNPE